MHKITQNLKFLFITIVFVVSAGSDASASRPPIEIQLGESDFNHVILKLEIPNFQFGEMQSDGQIWRTVSFPGCAYTCSEGKPKLPIKTTLIGIPPGVELDLQLLDSDYSSRKISQIEYVKHVSVGSDRVTQAVQPVPRQSAPRSINKFYPDRVVELGFTGYIRDARVVQVQFNPVQYNPATGTIKLYHKLKAKVIFVRTPASPSHSVGQAVSLPTTESKIFKQILERNILNYDLSKKWQSKGNRVMTSPAISNPSPAHSCKIYVDKDGIYSITYNQLKYALPELDEIDPRTFKMYNKGKPIPIFVRGETDGKFDPNDEIIFYGVHNRGEYAYYDRYSVENVYWLYWTGKIGTRMIEHKVDHEVDMSNVLRYRKYKYLVHIEENNRFVRLPLATDNVSGDYIYLRRDGDLNGYLIRRGSMYFLPPLPFDNWYWDLIGAPDLRSYSFKLPDVAETSLSASVRVALRGRSANPNIQPDHHTRIWLNGKKLLEDAKWDGQELHVFDSDEISQDYLVKGTNEITIICPGDTQAKEIDQVLLDWIEVEYWRDYEAVDNLLEFSISVSPYRTQLRSGGDATDIAMVNISGFSTNDVEVYGTDGSKYTGIAVVEDEQTPGKYKAIFRVPGSGIDPNIRYIALAPYKFNKPKAIIKDEPSYLRSPSNGADYIIITHDDFLPGFRRNFPPRRGDRGGLATKTNSGVRELAELRVTQGLRVAIVTVQNIYDEFNYGILSPYAIRDFLTYAYENWRPPAPSFVTLIGDAKNIKPTPSNGSGRSSVPSSLEAYVPTILVRSIKYGAAVSDFQFSLLHGEDALPDIIVSRLPVNNMIELSDVIEKIISYEKHRILGPWRKRLLFLAGTTDKWKVDFSSQSDNLIERYVPQPFEISHIYSDNKSPYYGETMDVIDAINSGNLVVSFIGHGGGGIWSDNRMMGLEDIDLLENKDNYPFILSMSCFTGDFGNEHRQCLGEKMVIAEKKGAIGFLGATGLGWGYGDYYLAQDIFDSLFASINAAAELSSDMSPQTTIGSIVTDAKINFLSKYGSYIDLAEMFTLLGDSAQVFEFPERSIVIQTPGAIESNDTLKISGSIVERAAGSSEDSRLDNGNIEIIISSPPEQEGGVVQADRRTTRLDGKQFSLQTQIPPTSKSGVGMITAYAWNEDTDAIGATTYSIGMPHISNISIEPPIKLNSRSYLYAEAYGTGNLSLYSYWTYNPAEEDWTKVPMSLVKRIAGSLEVKDNLYRTDSPLPSDNPFYYYLELTDGKDRTVKTSRQYYRVATYPELAFTEKKIRWIVDSSSVLLVEVKNVGDVPADNITVRFYEGSIDRKDQIGKDQIITKLNPDDYTIVQIQWEPKKDQHTIFVAIDPNEKIREKNEFNNVISEQFFGDKFVLTPKKGSNGAIQSLDGNLTFNLAGGKISQNAILEIKKLDPISLRQPDLKYAPLPEDLDGAVYSLTIEYKDSPNQNSPETTENVIANQAEQAEFSANLSIQPDLSQVPNVDHLKIYWYEPNTSKWMLAGKDSVQNDKITAEIIMSGSLQSGRFFASLEDRLYALMESNDRTPPEVDITIEHQGFIPGSYVSETPVISVALRDENGIDIREKSACEISDRLILLEDQNKVDRSEYSVSASPVKSGLVLLAYSPNLSPGQHTLTVQAFDSSGNLGEDTIEFRVAGELEIEKIANYPNPIKPGNNRSRGEGTIFAYILTKEADRVTLKIYTGAGRLVKSFDYLDVFADYNEFFWDGLDEDGDELSNGIYFYKMKTERDDKVTEKVGKLVILR